MCVLCIIIFHLSEYCMWASVCVFQIICPFTAGYYTWPLYLVLPWLHNCVPQVTISMLSNDSFHSVRLIHSHFVFITLINLTSVCTVEIQSFKFKSSLTLCISVCFLSRVEDDGRRAFCESAQVPPCTPHLRRRHWPPWSPFSFPRSPQQQHLLFQEAPGFPRLLHGPPQLQTWVRWVTQSDSRSHKLV